MAALGILLLPLGVELAPLLFYNASASAPPGVYIRAAGDPGRGDYVALHLPAHMRDFVAGRGYLPAGLPLLKQVAGVPGERVCRIGLGVWVEGKLAATALKTDSRGRPLPVWHGCQRLGAGEFLLLNAHPASFDSRYFGPVTSIEVIGRAVPLWGGREPSQTGASER